MIEFVTSVSGVYYRKYGRRMVEGFVSYVDPSITLRLYTEAKWEEGIWDYSCSSSERVKRFDLADVPGADEFLKISIPKVREKIGFYSTDPDVRLSDPRWNYRFDAVTFGKKALAITHSLRTSRARYLFWIDADVVFLSPIDAKLLVGLLDGSAVAYHGRSKPHSETGFIAFDLAHPGTRTFTRLYSSFWEPPDPKIFTLPGWTDCDGFDRAVYEAVHWDPLFRAKNLSFQTENDVIGTGPLRGYITHEKGSKKKSNRQVELWTIWGAKPDGELFRLHPGDRAVKQVRARAIADGLAKLSVRHELRPASSWTGEAVSSIASGAPDIWRACAQAKVHFWAVDNGFFRAPAKGVDVELCYLRLASGRPMPRFRTDVEAHASRFDRFGIRICPWRTNKYGHILLCPPRGGLARYYGIVEEQWISEVTDALPARFRDRVRIRRKGDPGTFAEATAGALTVVSHSSRVAIEALSCGVPAVETEGTVRDWNVLSPEAIGRVDLCKADRVPLFRYLAWTQFTLDEMRSGFAWRVSTRLQCDPRPVASSELLEIANG